MSSLRNAVYRRQHRERGQLAGREKWGILEKHKVSCFYWSYVYIQRAAFCGLPRFCFLHMFYFSP